jgi:hypothetical protein
MEVKSFASGLRAINSEKEEKPESNSDVSFRISYCADKRELCPRF